MRFLSVSLAFLTVCAGLCTAASGDNPQAGGSGTSGTVRGTVTDPSGAAVPGASVSMQNPVSHYSKSATTDGQGKFEFANVPFNHYHIAVTAAGFGAAEKDVDLRSPVAVDLPFALQLGTEATSVTVTADAADLITTDTVTHTDLDRSLFEKLPVENNTSSLSALVTLATPGVSGDSNGMMHGLGDHASNSFSVDGQSITDQQSKTFSNQVPVDSVQSMEVIEGAPPAEYGDKTSLVIVVTTRSGLGMDKAHGSITTSYGSFGTASTGFDLGFGSKTVGNFIAGSGMDTGRFLDAPEFGVMHDHGNQFNVFDRLDFKPSAADSINLNFSYTRSWFQNPNSFDAQSASAWSGLTVNNGGRGPDGQVVGPTDQRSQIRTFNIAPNWTRSIGNNYVFTFGVYTRQDHFNYYPSRDPFSDLIPDLQRETVGQNRTLTNVGGHASITWVNGVHNVKAGITYNQTFLNENDSLGIVDPSFNPVCMNANGSAFTGPSIVSPTRCTGGLSRNPDFVPILGCYDLTRTATLPAADGCPGGASGLYRFSGHTDVKELSLYIQDSITAGNWVFNLGLRGDIYNGLASGSQVEPRLGLSYNVKPTNSVLRLSYARTLETPFNENLILASVGCNDAVLAALIAAGGPCTNTPLAPGWRNEFHAGFSRHSAAGATGDRCGPGPARPARRTAASCAR